MIPRTYPSRVNSTTGRVEALVSFISSTTGLQRWVDYTPVAFVTDATPVEGSYNNNGYIAVADVGSTTGLQAGKDYIRVFLDPNATDAWRVNSVGFIPVGYSGIGGIPYALFANNEQGVWYDPSDINLAWRRNLLTYTEQFDNAAWSKVRTTVGANAVLAPDGTTTADKIIATSASGSHYVSQGGTQAVVTASVLAKAAEYGVLQIAAAVAGDQFANFDLVGGALGSVGVGATNASITSVGNGWYLCQCSFAITSSIGAIFAVAPLKTSGWLPSFVGDDTSGIYLWGAQLEVGSTASTYQRITDGVQDYYAYQAQPVLFQDSAGTTPVTAVEQPVGLMLDKSKGLVYSTQLAPTPDFSSATGWTVTGDWVITGGRAEKLSTTTNSNLSFTAPAVAGNAYLFEFDVVQQTGTNNVFVNTTATQAAITSGTGRKRVLVFSNLTGSSVGFAVRALAANTLVIDNISVRELPGNHAFQATSTSRPVLSARYNLLTKTEQFGDAEWIAAVATKASTTEISPIGTPTAAKISLNAVASGSYSVLYRNSVALSGTLTDSLWIKGQLGTEIVYLFYVVDGVYRNKRCVLTTEWQRFSFDFAGGAACFWHVGVDMRAGSGQETRPAQDIYIWGADLRVTNDAAGQPAYQRVNTATDYDTAGFKPYLRFDGTDDSLQTNSIDFTATDKMTVFAGVRKLSDAARGVLAELSASTAGNAGSFVLTAPEGATSNYGFGSRGSILNSPVAASPFAAPITNVLTGIGNISGDSVILRVNGAQSASDTADQGTGNYGNYPLYIGRRGGTTLPFNGRLYGLIVRGAATTTATIQATETYMNGKTGAY